MNQPLLSSKFDAVICILIYLVKYNPVLYDTGHVLYGDKEAKSRAWTKIAQKLGEDEEWCKSTWESLKTCYFKRMKLCKEEREEWPYDNAMSFLDPYIGNSSSPNPRGTRSSGDEARDGSSRRLFTNPRTFSFSVEELQEGPSERIACCCGLM